MSSKTVDENGFGYDPVFFVEQSGKTFAKIMPEYNVGKEDSYMV